MTGGKVYLILFSPPLPKCFLAAFNIYADQDIFEW
jgi:hypothetical protein